MGIEPPKTITDPKDAEAIIESMMKAWGDLRMARGQFEQMATGVRKYALWDLYPPDNPCGSEAALAKLLFRVDDLDEAKLTYQQRGDTPLDKARKAVAKLTDDEWRQLVEARKTR